MRSIFVLGVLVAALSSRATAQDGKALYDEHCKKCHGATGKPSAPMKKKYEKIEAFDAAFFSKRTDEQMVKVLVDGKGDNMKSFKDKLTTDADRKAVVAYLHTLKP
jgi:mono/diheme cytochrome c family protein